MTFSRLNINETMSFGELDHRRGNYHNLPEFQLAKNDGYEGRCGEVFLTFKRILVFHCSFCDSKYGSFDNFLEHLAVQHNEDVQQEAFESEPEIDIDCQSQDEESLYSEMADESYNNTKRSNRLSGESAEDKRGANSMDDQCMNEIKEENMSTDNEDYESYACKTLNKRLEEFKEEVCTEDENDAEEDMYEENCLEELEDDETLGALEETLFEYDDLKIEEQSMDEPKVSIVKRIDQSIERSLSPNKRKQWPYTEVDGGNVAPKKDKEPNVFRCDVCTKVFTEKRFLRKHYEIHCTERKYKCGTCGLAFKTYTNAYAHMRRHQKEKKKNGCDYCSRTFFTRTEAVSHMRTHTGERPYICSFCGIGFQTSSKLTAHSRLHTEEVIKCSYCEKEFFGKKALDHHMLIHTKEKPFSCSICSASFARRKSMVRHTKKHES